MIRTRGVVMRMGERMRAGADCLWDTEGWSEQIGFHKNETGVSHCVDMDGAIGDSGMLVDIGNPVGHEESEDQEADPRAEFGAPFTPDHGQYSYSEGYSGDFPEPEDCWGLVFHHCAGQRIDLVHSPVGDIEDGQIEINHRHCGD